MFAAALVAGLALATAQADEPAALQPSPPIARGIAAFPRLVAAPGDRVVSRINRALARADLAPGCRDDGRGTWHRTVRVTMRGPRFLSLLAADDWYCGGPYADGANTALVYDLATGAPADWRRLLPGGIVEAVASERGGGDADPVLVVSAALRRLYVAARQSGIEDCAAVLADTERFPSRFMLWPDAAANGLTLQLVSLPHVVRACGPPVTLARPELRRLGAAPAFLQAIAEAHRRGWFDPPAK
jgi:hypothetical protein